MSKFRHPNLVILMGFACSNNSERCLVYERLEGDVHGALKGSPENHFDGERRMKAVLDCSLSLSHFHSLVPSCFH